LCCHCYASILRSLGVESLGFGAAERVLCGDI
jgi:hypothetical protein